MFQTSYSHNENKFHSVQGSIIQNQILNFPSMYNYPIKNINICTEITDKLCF